MDIYWMGHSKVKEKFDFFFFSFFLCFLESGFWKVGIAGSVWVLGWVTMGSFGFLLKILNFLKLS